MDEAIIKTRGSMLRWHQGEFASITNAGDLPVLQYGTEVSCGIGAAVLSRKMSPTKDFKGRHGRVAVVHIEKGANDRPLVVELGVHLDRGVAWFSPADLTLTLEHQEVPSAS
jgi:hypothetical protein